MFPSADFYSKAFQLVFETVKKDQPDFSPAHWKTVVVDFSEAQLSGLRSALIGFFEKYPTANASDVESFVEDLLERQLQGCLVHYKRSVIRVSRFVDASFKDKAFAVPYCGSWLTAVSDFESMGVEYPLLKRWAEWWGRPSVCKILCFTCGGPKKLREWLQVCTTNAVESQNKVSKMGGKRSFLQHVLDQYLMDDQTAQRVANLDIVPLFDDTQVHRRPNTGIESVFNSLSECDLITHALIPQRAQRFKTLFSETQWKAGCLYFQEGLLTAIPMTPHVR